MQGEVRNTRDPSAPPSSRQGGSYKPKAKSSAAQRESEGIVVPTMAATNNAAGGKGPCGGHVGSGGKREGMAGTTGPNHPGRRKPVDKVRRLQRSSRGRAMARCSASCPAFPGRQLRENRLFPTHDTNIWFIEYGGGVEIRVTFNLKAMVDSNGPDL